MLKTGNELPVDHRSSWIFTRSLSDARDTLDDLLAHRSLPALDMIRIQRVEGSERIPYGRSHFLL